ncbi:MAG: hypothetical protein ACYTF7_09120, partial [Planctomycetota bacterium]
MSSDAAQSVGVDLGERSYEVLIGGGTLAALTDLLTTRCAGATRVMLAVDHNLPQETVERCARTILSAGLLCLQQVLIASEEHKSASTHHDLLTRMAMGGLDRHDLVVALGGGIV